MESKRSFDWYGACVAAGITGPFAIWALWVLLHPHYAWIVVAGLAFVSFVFWGFGKIRIS